MESRGIFRGILWTVVAILLVGHIAGGWYYSSELIDRGFTPDPSPLVLVEGDYEIEEVTYSSDIGEMDAWYLPSSGATWVIHVHGKGPSPAEAEHLFAPLQDAGYPQLAIAYRNDDQQPPDPSGFYQYGVTEFADIAGAMDYAQSNGADRVVFSGFSTGSSHILSFVFKNNLDDIKGLLFDSPNINFGDTVDYNGSQEELPILPFNLPQTVIGVGKFFTSLRIDVNWKAIDYIEKSEGSLRVPVLIHHGVEDLSVPVTQSIEFAELHPDLVRLVQVPDTGHVESFDTDPEAYVSNILGFLDQLD